MSALADQYNAELVRRLQLEAVLDELYGQSEQREQDRVYAFCIHGLGHDEVHVDPPDPSVGIFGIAAWCERCGTDLSDDELINPVKDDL